MGIVERIELAVTALGITAAVAGYLLNLPVMTFFGILLGAIAFGVLLARSIPKSE